MLSSYGSGTRISRRTAAAARCSSPALTLSAHCRSKGSAFATVCLFWADLDHSSHARAPSEVPSEGADERSQWKRFLGESMIERPLRPKTKGAGVLEPARRPNARTHDCIKRKMRPAR
jgi:hypothetical protein